MRREGSEQMQVIGHDDVTAYEDSMHGGLRSKVHKGLVNFLTGKNPTAFMGAGGNEIDRADGKDELEALQTRLEHKSILSETRCSGGL